jgi:hypothetical protein
MSTLPSRWLERARPEERVLRHPMFLSREPGDGALSVQECFHDRHAPETGYESDAATMVGTPGERDARAARLQRINEGRHRSDGRHSVRESRRDRTRIAQALCNSLDLPPAQRDEVLRYVDELNFDRFGSQKAIPRVALAVIRHVADTRRFEADPSDPDRIADEAEFRALLDDHGMDKGDLMRISQVFKEWLRERDERENGGVGFPGRDPNLPDVEDV